MKDDDNHILLLEKGKRGLLQIIFGRTGIIIVSLIVQILFLFAAFYKLEGFLPYFWGGNTLLSAAVVLFLFGNDDNPTIKLTWFFATTTSCRRRSTSPPRKARVPRRNYRRSSKALPPT